MNYSVLALAEFKKNTKKLSKRYQKIKVDILSLVIQLETDPYLGTHLFENCYKIRIPNSSVPTGKSGGFRVLTYCVTETSKIYLLTIYSKSDQENVSDSKIIDLIKSIEIE
ncbi:MAG: hypothetical protein WC141_00715 [Arcobacteraceae bacterium]